MCVYVCVFHACLSCSGLQLPNGYCCAELLSHMPKTSRGQPCTVFSSQKEEGSKLTNVFVEEEFC